MIYGNNVGNSGYAHWQSNCGYNNTHQYVNMRPPCRFYPTTRERASGYHYVPQSTSRCASGYHYVPQSTARGTSGPSGYQSMSQSTTLSHQPYANSFLSRARCSTVKQPLDSYPGVTSSAQSQPQSGSSQLPTAAASYTPETSLSWEEQFVDLSSFCHTSSSAIQMALSSDEGLATSSQATEQRNGPDVFFGSDLVASGSDIGLDMLDNVLYRGVGGGKGAPALKLNVDLIGTEPEALSTPDVIKAFDDVESFDLLDYVFNQDKKPVLYELDKAQSEDLLDSDPALSLLLGKSTAPPLPSLTPLVDKGPLATNSSLGNTPAPKPKQIATVRPKRIKQKKMFEDFVYDNIMSPGKRPSHLSDVTVKREEDSDTEFPTSGLLSTGGYCSASSGPKKKLLTLPARKRNISCSSTSSSFSLKKRRLTDDEDTLEYESGKYRELRNRNNEASRRSRANRKQREMKMKEYSDRLIADNGRLKAKAEQLERQVERFRSCLMKIVLSSKNKR